jgi:hypothetical protein
LTSSSHIIHGAHSATSTLLAVADDAYIGV